jgi:MFS family permease
MIIAYVDRANISVALALPAFRKLFQLTDSQRGALNSAFFWSYAFLQIPAGYVVDRYGVKWPYAISFVLWSLFSAATAFATTVGQIVVLRLLLGIGEAIVTPASMRWIRFNVPESQRRSRRRYLHGRHQVRPGHRDSDCGVPESRLRMAEHVSSFLASAAWCG